MLTADSRGHFINTGLINGQVMQYMVDTGASTVAIGRPDADRMGLDYANGQPVRMGTANGVGMGWRLKLDSVRIGDVEVFGVEAIVTSQPMPFVLLGNSFLAEFQMTRNSDQMVLEKRR
ncbi:MAG: TIGR02281 family clan AA aspartic protease [Burkholderiaceae bacterium]|nr:MAG: TIGR02281 family clan AA aspartic protease [Burkholderiaceae bacterium]